MVATQLRQTSPAQGSTHKRVEDYGLIGNMVSSALVGADGSIDWMCLPRFDSPACFAALLGSHENGHWRIAPRGAIGKTTRQYLEDTAVLETRFETGTGIVTVTDFMPLTDDEQKIDLVRIVTGVAGRVEMEMEFVLRFNYGQAVPWVRRRDYGLSAIAGPDAVELHTTLPLNSANMRTTAVFTTYEGSYEPLTLSYHNSHQQPHFVRDRRESLERTAIWWREWVKRGSFASMPSPWREPVVRSLITLKMLSFAPTGGIVAAPTTSLPEAIGGSRNWDYRYCWLRDSALTLYALLNAGYRSEAEAWRQWLLRSVAGHPQQLQIMYGIAGERWLPEFKVPWLAGYEQSQPVRVGNGAADQLQLDVYGELLDTLNAARDAELQPETEAWQLQKVLVQHLEEIWQTPDRGIWEVRGPARIFTHSRAMCWVALDRTVTTAERFDLDGPIDRWRELRAKIHDDICEHGFDRQLDSFVQYYGGKTLDASLLMLPQLGFLPPHDSRILGTITAIEQNLRQGPLIKRYSTQSTDDGVGGPEGGFIACSFWLADAYVLVGRHADALALYDELLGLRNDLGLLSEQCDPTTKRLLGNFPQAFSHIALINTAHNLVKNQGPAQQRAQQVAPSTAEAVDSQSFSAGAVR